MVMHVFVYSNAGFDWQEQTIVPMVCNGNHAIDPELCPGAGVASLVKQHKLRIGHSRGSSSGRASSRKRIGRVEAKIT